MQQSNNQNVYHNAVEKEIKKNFVEQLDDKFDPARYQLYLTRYKFYEIKRKIQEKSMYKIKEVVDIDEFDEYLHFSRALYPNQFVGIKPVGKEQKYMQMLDLLLYNLHFISAITSWYEYSRLGYPGLCLVLSLMIFHGIWSGFFEYNYFLFMSIAGKN